MSRKVKYDIHIANRILTAVAEGKTLRAIANQPGMPSTGVIYKWTRIYPEFAKAMNEADEWSARMLEEEGIDEARGGTKLPDAAKTGAVRALNEQLRWSAERRDPGKYGSSAKVNVRVPVQIITSLNLGQPGLPPKSEERSVYDIEAENILEVPFEEVKALPPPPPVTRSGPQKRVLVPRNPFWNAAQAATKRKEARHGPQQAVFDGEQEPVQAASDDEGLSAEES